MKRAIQWYLWHTPQNNTQERSKLRLHAVYIVVGLFILWAAGVTHGWVTVLTFVAWTIVYIVLFAPSFCELGPHHKKYVEAKEAMLRALVGNCAPRDDFLRHFSRLYGKYGSADHLTLLKLRGFIAEETADGVVYVSLTNLGRQAYANLTK